VSAIFLGKLVGNTIGGPWSDSLGRRLPILFSYAAVSASSAVAAFAPGFWVLCAARFILGLFFGVAQSAWTVLCTEITPADWRMWAYVASNVLFILGELYGGYLVWYDDPLLKKLAWRWLTVLAASPAVMIGFVAAFSLKESASWLALHGENGRAEEVLQSIRWWNSKEQEESVSLAPCSAVVSRNGLESIRLQISVAFGPALRYSTSVLCFTCFVLNFVYYGGFYSFPLVLEDIHMGLSPALALVLGVLWELPGFLAAALFSKVCGRRLSILAYLVLMTCSIILFVKGAENEASGHAVYYYMIHAGYAGIKCWINMGFLLAYQYVAEVYPTSARAAGTGLCMGSGRFASIVVPFVFEALSGIFTNAWQIFFYMMATVCVLNALLVAMLPFETWGMTLKDHIDEMSAAEPLMACTTRKV